MAFPPVLEKLLFDLGTIAAITVGDKLSTFDEYLNIESTYGIVQAAWRTVHRDTRQRAITSINATINTVVEYSERIIESKYFNMAAVSSDDFCEYEKRIVWLRSIKDHIDRSVAGIANLANTYPGDRTISGKIRPLINIIRGQSVRIKVFLDNISHAQERQNVAQLKQKTN